MKPQIKSIPIHSINLGLDVFQVDYEKVIKVAESLRNHGLIEPITVKMTSGKYYIVIGKIRCLAAVLAGSRDIPAMIIDGGNYDQSSKRSELKSYVNNKLRLLNLHPTKLNQRNSFNMPVKEYL